MRKYLFFAGLLAFAATFTACSSDDEAVTPEQKLEGNAFMAVQLVAPSSTRADYEEYNEAEDNVSAVKFFFYDKDGNFVVAGNKVSSLEAEKTSVGSVSVVYGEVIALQTSSKISNVTQVLAVANDGDAAEFNGLSLADAKKLATSTLTTSEKAFVMTGSVYDGDEYGTYDCTDKLYETADDAKKAPVNVYVERLAAKVKVTNTISAEGVSVKDNVYTDGAVAEKNLTVKVLGWALNCLEPQEYYIKNITSGSNYFTGWNNATAFRCFWAEDAHYDLSTYDSHGYTTDDSECGLDYVQASDLVDVDASTGAVTAKTNATPATSYCFENTYQSNGFASYLSASTSLLVIAQFGDGETNYVRFGGNLYEEADYKAAAINASALSNYYYQKASDPETYESIGAIAEVQSNEADLVDGQVVIQIPEATTVYSSTDGKTFTEVTDGAKTINTTLKTTSVGYGFKGGLMYYSVPIKHLVGRSDSEASTFAQPQNIGEYGVVRNHSYSISLNSISGLGHAIWEPDEHIVPVDGDTNYYLAAKLNVQAWRIVPTQGVDLGK